MLSVSHSNASSFKDLTLLVYAYYFIKMFGFFWKIFANLCLCVFSVQGLTATEVQKA